MLIYLRVLKESLAFAINALRNNKLRTLLSLLGVTIGIFSIIGVLAAVDSLKQEIKGSLSSLDNNTIILMRFSFGPTDIPQWKREQFPDVTYEEYQYIKRNVPDVEAASFSLNVGAESIKYDDKLVTGVNIAPVTDGYYNIEALKLAEGRFFNESESNSGSNVLVLGSEIADGLFGSFDPIGKQVRLLGQRFTVIGVLEKEGSSFIGPSKDGVAVLPVNVVRRIYGSNNKSAFPQITIKPKDGVDIAEFNAILEQRLRQLRGLRPEETNTFFINQLSGLTDFIDNITGTMSTIGGFIGLFSLLVGGFGIANIMFVSVKERTNLIGIQKALGAKNRFILLQFLFESVILATIGGLIGLTLVWIIAQVMSQFTGDFEFVLSATNVIFGLSSSIIIGLIAGIVPAFMASRLDPVEAIRTGM
ncbi:MULTISPECIES: ABC transporter permease [Leeuwenhoekiella]|uniref:ABC-type transport systems, involved in lipoprotein release, permease component n=1 Tax=Leeuwenhoekiella blandensis (strain CECT 7118 / CCUG 51940 / KCTC 22103 / MED217) TaxID=398720 RepID=A3XQS3_LEEBM|nr:ABC transporter permease [Leeuwenhoekiella blandensis]EAQ48046.1 ABC-type transport systems, involved in lipoprotein release, permease component [Leeuwenhoekiella blandensis MED217]|tara:strand:+ start:475 stop:1728 length:1254 start_codon:yes stop_codon:yes gene_type:complete